MARYFAALALLGAVLADGGSHHAAHSAPSAPSAPASSYGAPSTGYEQPSYAAPEASYAPASYEQPSYDAPATGYAEPSAVGYDASYADPSFAADTVDGFDLSKLLELLPLFIAVFAAIILAQLLAPLFGVLFNAKLGLINPILQPFGQAKLDFMNNVILRPMGYVIANADPANLNNPANANWVPKGRSLDSFGVLDAIEIAQNLYEGKEYTELHCTVFLINIYLTFQLWTKNKHIQTTLWTKQKLLRITPQN